MIGDSTAEYFFFYLNTLMKSLDVQGTGGGARDYDEACHCFSHLQDDCVRDDTMTSKVNVLVMIVFIFCWYSAFG